MDTLNYFFGFYSIVLGLSVVELLGGVARTIETRTISTTSRLTLLVAAFVLLDMSSYWIQAWSLYRHAPLSMTVITHGLVAAGSYFVAAYLIFPRATKPRHGEGRDDHFWATRRWVFGAVLLTNVLNVGTMAVLTGGLGFIGSAPYTAFIATFYVACAIAAIAPRGRLVAGALIWLVVFSITAVLMDSASVVAAAGWSFEGLLGPAGQ